MIRRSRVALVGALVIAASLMACGPRPAIQAAPTSPVDGVVIEVDATSLTDVQGFTLRPNSGAGTLRFRLGPLENATQFPPGHLKAHQASALPVRVYFTAQADGDLVVYRLEDAPVSSGAPSSSP